MLVSEIMRPGSWRATASRFWQCGNLVRPGKLEFVYLLDWPDAETLTARWADFMADEEWAAIKRETGARYGTFVSNIQDRMLCLTSYSPAI